MSEDLTVVVMAKSPRPGQVKTRLCPPFTAGEAAALAQAALVDTLEVVLRTGARRRVLALDGPVGPWLPAGIEVVAQRGSGLDERIAGALAMVAGPVVVVGMDTPQLTVGHLSFTWQDHDAWFGPAEDGGFWGLALARPEPDLIRGVPMSDPRTGDRQLDRLRAAGLRVGLLPRMRDVDTAECAAVVAAQAPHTRFATVYAGLTSTASA